MRLLEPDDLTQPLALSPDEDLLIHADAALALPLLPDGAFDVIAIDPPFNTGRLRRHRRVRKTPLTVDPDAAPDPAVRATTGFAGRVYSTEVVSRLAYADAHDDFLAFIAPHLQQAHRLLAAHGTLYFHIDYREAHYCKVLLDDIFGRDCFLNEIVWAYDYGARTTKRWPAKHDTILVYVKDPAAYHFDGAAVDREPYMAPRLQTPERAAHGKLPTDVWWHTIVTTTGAERTGYPTQKPEGIVRRMVTASCPPGGRCLDFFAGSGTLGAVARKLDRRFVLVDDNPEAIAVIQARLGQDAAAAGA
ncbi:MAG: methylase domain protein [Solirubrobacterales bacterium]|nr:methylase domain protein [Solirubrobacterales bacterium]